MAVLASKVDWLGLNWVVIPFWDRFTGGARLLFPGSLVPFLPLWLRGVGTQELIGCH